MTNGADEGAIRAAAQRAFDRGPEARTGVQPGTPVLVRDLRDAPSYWLVPGLEQGAVVALARVLLDARVATLAWLPSPAASAVAVVTGLDERGARATAHALGTREPDTSVSEPVLVHDGPVGREAWRIDVASPAGTRSVFATGGGTYERSAED